MKKVLAVILTVFMMFSMGTMVVACDKTGDDVGQTQELTDEQKVRNAVERRAMSVRYGKIGGNEIKYSYATITNLKWSGESKCTVSGVLKLIDIYGTTWKNNFDCVVTSSDNGNTWNAGSFTYKNKWTQN